MKKRFWISAAGIAALGVATLAYAAVIENLNGQGCAPGYVGAYHFVNNQTGGAGAGTLSATWSTGDSCTVGATTVNRSNQHFNCTATGYLTWAATNLPGRLVLSDYSCAPQKCEGDKCEPPPCDPKTQKCDPPK